MNDYMKSEEWNQELEQLQAARKKCASRGDKQGAKIINEIIKGRIEMFEKLKLDNYGGDV